jgi:CheY-like chemotaxis protein
MSAVPTVYFIDDSATMREVIKIAFRRENMNVLATHDAVNALAEIEEKRPDIVITDVIMPEKDGYEVCQFIKSHPELSNTPVILMSGVVNRTVAEKAFAVKADELLRKPFQPQDLITRVRHLLSGNTVPLPTPAAAASAAMALSSIFAAPPPPMPSRSVPQTPAPQARVAAVAVGSSVMDFPIASSVTVPEQDPLLEPMDYAPVSSVASAPPLVPEPRATTAVASSPVLRSGNGAESTRIKVEVMRLEGLVKKLQAELGAEREYCRALEAHIRTLQEAD